MYLCLMVPSTQNVDLVFTSQDFFLGGGGVKTKSNFCWISYLVYIANDWNYRDAEIFLHMPVI